jgi:hypothetical protein
LQFVIWFFAAGAAIGVLATFPLAALTALVFRFPIPFGSYMSGPGAVMPAIFAAAFYGMIGGFMVQAVLGGIAGVLGARAGPPDRKGAWRRCATFAILAALPGVLILSILDWIIGPW